MYDLFEFSLADLFKIRDACVMLKSFNVYNQDLLNEANKEIKSRELNPLDDPDKERN
jgi:hypothetical protein